MNTDNCIRVCSFVLPLCDVPLKRIYLLGINLFGKFIPKRVHTLMVGTSAITLHKTTFFKRWVRPLKVCTKQQLVCKNLIMRTRLYRNHFIGFRKPYMLRNTASSFAFFLSCVRSVRAFGKAATFLVLLASSAYLMIKPSSY